MHYYLRVVGCLRETRNNCLQVTWCASNYPYKLFLYTWSSWCKQCIVQTMNTIFASLYYIHEGENLFGMWLLLQDNSLYHWNYIMLLEYSLASMNKFLPYRLRNNNYHICCYLFCMQLFMTVECPEVGLTTTFVSPKKTLHLNDKKVKLVRVQSTIYTLITCP